LIQPVPVYSGETSALPSSIACRTPKLPGVFVRLVTSAPAAASTIDTMLPRMSCSVKSLAMTVIFAPSSES
jgi:hypothetical protein